MGFLLRNNILQYNGELSYNLLKPSKKIINQIYKVRFTNSYLYNPFNWSNLEVGTSAFLLFKNFWDLNINFVSSPIWYNDYFVNSNTYTGYFLKRTPYYYLGIKGNTDSRKKILFSYNIGGAESPLPNDPYWATELGLRFRVNEKLQVSSSMAIKQDNGNWGWAFVNNTNRSPVIARRKTKENTGIISAQYNFTKRMNLTIRGRHYWSALENTNFYNLKSDGFWKDTIFLANRNINFNTFNIDMFYTWDFLLGSRITIGWKNALGSNAIINAYSNTSYFKNLGQSISNPHSNEVTIKVIYFLDYLNLRKSSKK